MCDPAFHQNKLALEAQLGNASSPLTQFQRSGLRTSAWYCELESIKVLSAPPIYGAGGVWIPAARQTEKQQPRLEKPVVFDMWADAQIDLRPDGDAVQAYLTLMTGKPTVPYVFANGEFVGGSEVLHSLLCAIPWNSFCTCSHPCSQASKPIHAVHNSSLARAALGEEQKRLAYPVCFPDSGFGCRAEAWVYTACRRCCQYKACPGAAKIHCARAFLHVWCVKVDMSTACRRLSRCCRLARCRRCWPPRRLPSAQRHQEWQPEPLITAAADCSAA